MNKFILPTVLIITSSLVGCQTIPKDAFKLTESNLEMRQMQSRLFETKDEVELISSSISVLQDLGYNIENTEKEVGLVTASKMADATNAGQIAGAILLSALAGTPVHYDDKKRINVSIVTIPDKKGRGYYARATFQTVVWSTQGVVTRVETISNPELYNDFFDKLHKSVFLENIL